MNWGIIGHEWAVDMLKAHIQNNQVRHAYLICGPAGVGRRTLALRLTQALNCEHVSSSGEPCFECRTCKQIEAMQYADLLVVQLDETHEKVLVDQIRDLQRNLSLHPYEGQYKVALLRNFDLATENTENSLLKTLEEPPEKVILIITAENPEKLAPTVVSRCEILRLRPVSFESLTSALQDKVGLSAEDGQIFAHVSTGLPGLALSLMRDHEKLDNRHEDLSSLFVLLDANLARKFVFAEACNKGHENPSKLRANLREMFGVWLSFWRDVAVVQNQASVPIYNLDHLDQIKQAASYLDNISASEIICLIERAKELLDRNVNPRLVVEVLLLDLPPMHLQTTAV